MAKAAGPVRKRGFWAQLLRWRERRALEADSVLDVFTLESLKKDPDTYRQLKHYFWQYHFDLAGQRREKKLEIAKALHDAVSHGFVEIGWQRAVQLRYSLRALSCVGSMKSDCGGRFNIGSMDTQHFQTFPALYIASDRETAIQELLAQGNAAAGLSNHDFALRKPDSLTCVSLAVKLERYIDLGRSERLKPLMDVLADFTVSDTVAREAVRLGLPRPTVITTTEQLVESLLDASWRRNPERYDLPSNSQIFGEMAHAAGVQGIVYPSKMTGKNAIAVFTRNFFESEFSSIELQDVAPPEMLLRRIDSSNFKDAES